MRVPAEHKKKVKKKIIDAAGQGFREEGYGGLGVDGLAKRAGLTSGAFYGHFPSKDEAFKAAVTHGLKDYAQTILILKEEHGEKWPQALIDYYLGDFHVHAIADGCAVPGLSADVMRADNSIKEIYEDKIKQVAEAIATNLKSPDTDKAWSLMALLAGAVMMARCVENDQTAKEILTSAKHQAEAIIAQG